MRRGRAAAAVTRKCGHAASGAPPETGGISATSSPSWSTRHATGHVLLVHGDGDARKLLRELGPARCEVALEVGDGGRVAGELGFELAAELLT